MSTMLTIQYRMNEQIALASSHHFYNSKLMANKGNQKQTLQDMIKTLPDGQSIPKSRKGFLDTRIPIVWIDHNCPEQNDDLTKSVKNPEEVNIHTHMRTNYLYV